DIDCVDDGRVVHGQGHRQFNQRVGGVIAVDAKGTRVAAFSQTSGIEGDVDAAASPGSGGAAGRADASPRNVVDSRASDRCYGGGRQRDIIVVDRRGPVSEQVQSAQVQSATTRLFFRPCAGVEDVATVVEGFGVGV